VSTEYTIVVVAAAATIQAEYFQFLADRTIGRAFATARRLSVCLSVCL